MSIFKPSRGNPKSPETALPQVDTSKRYDVYCAEMGLRIVVYRNVRFKGTQRLLSAQRFDVMADFIELEQASGQAVFISKHSLIKFCEHSVEPILEVVTPK